MRREYEAAVGRLITNQTAMALFQNDEDVFLRDYDLDVAERESLLAMKVQLQGMCSVFTGKRARIIERPVTRTLALLGDYGGKLLRRYINLYPPSGDYAVEHQQFVRFVETALSSAEGIENIMLVCNVLRLESSLYMALRSVIPGEGVEHINDPAPSWNIDASKDTLIAVRSGVFFGVYDYNLTNIVQMSADDLAVLKPEPVALIALRRFGEVTNTLIRVSPSVTRALSAIGNDGRSVSEVASLLVSPEDPTFDTTVQNLIGLVRNLSSQQVFVEVK